jgi:flavin reductase (DIM6/NTAB) family NADH-FMN oxidoreductase RutF
MTVTHPAPHAPTTPWWETILASYASTVALATARTATGEPVGMLVSSFVAISQEPPMIGFFGSADSESFRAISAAGRLTVSIPAARQRSAIHAFGHKEADRFTPSDFVDSVNGLPRLRDAVAWIDATIIDERAYGDHILAVAAVDRFGTGELAEPLLYRHGGYGTFLPSPHHLQTTVASEGVDP